MQWVQYEVRAERDTLYRRRILMWVVLLCTVVVLVYTHNKATAASWSPYWTADRKVAI